MSSIIRDREVQGAVVLVADDAPMDTLNEMNRLVPIVWAMGGHAGPVEVDHVSENNSAIGSLAHHYLQSQGCRKIGFLSMVPHKRNARERGQAFAAAAAEHHQSCRSYLVSENRLMSALYGENVITRSNLNDLVGEIAAFASLDGLFVDRDATTARVYPLLIKAGIEPGRDIKIVSCDNDELALSGLSPRPASIDLGVEDLAARIVRRLMLRIENREEPPILLQTMPQLRVGETEFAEFGQRVLRGAEGAPEASAETGAETIAAAPMLVS
jgi:DNA-binding LacI/PurR family transcriptional regulator